MRGPLAGDSLSARSGLPLYAAFWLLAPASPLLLLVLSLARLTHFDRWSLVVC